MKSVAAFSFSSCNREFLISLGMKENKFLLLCEGIIFQEIMYLYLLLTCVL